ncbi:MAG: sigma 54-interacting transcriptional regulator [Bacteroidota bacterium]
MSFNLQSVKQRFGIIGRSPALDRALSTAMRVAPTDLTVLITGESGVGKEAFSNIIHQLSPRKHSKFIAINCGAIPEGTINSELFGHEKGAFTGANSDRKGYFETADGGTIFLDEIGEMPLDTQTYLLRILETGEFIRVGSSKELKTNVRVVAATNADLIDKVNKGKFREDLYYRLNTVPIYVPSLRERREDIFLLFRKFAVDFAEKYRSKTVELDESAIEILQNYEWPGNIRELKNIAEQVSVLSTERYIGQEELTQFIPTARRRNLPVVAQAANGESFAEREILYKLLFDMKKDLNDLKSLVFELIRTNNLTLPNVSEINSLKSLQPIATSFPNQAEMEQEFSNKENANQPIILDQSHEYKPTHEVEESLSLEDNEKDLIKKALKKHKSKRKNAAAELGISERTLYRKIKYYNIKE